MDQVFVQHAIAQYARDFYLRARIYRTRLTLLPTAGNNSGEQPMNIPTETPFLWTQIGWSSQRPREGVYTSIKITSEQVVFTSDPVMLGAFCGPDGTRSPCWWGPTKIVTTDRFRINAFRETTVDPAETFPGPAVNSLIEVSFFGFDLMPKDSKDERVQV